MRQSIVILFLSLSFCVESHIIFDENSLFESDDAQPSKQRIFSYYADIKANPANEFLGTGEILYCGGAIIGRTWIITHPRCCQSGYVYRVFVNTTEHCRGNEVGVYECEVDKDNNVALIKTNPIRFTEDVKAIQIPTKSNPHSALNGRIFLAGREYDSKIFSDWDYGLAETDIDFSSNTNCSVLDLETFYCGTNPTENGNIAYPGSPLILKSNHGLVLIGIYKYTVEGKAVFVRTSKYIDWMEDITGASLDK